jgi:hypothetical protein
MKCDLHVHLAFGLEVLAGADGILPVRGQQVALTEQRTAGGFAGCFSAGVEQAREGLVGLEAFVLVDRDLAGPAGASRQQTGQAQQHQAGDQPAKSGRQQAHCKVRRDDGRSGQ